VRSKGRRQKQAAGLSAKLRDELIAACGHDPRGLRDQAMIAVGYDTLCRRSELVQLRADDIERLAAQKQIKPAMAGLGICPQKR
jgi:integrase